MNPIFTTLQSKDLTLLSNSLAPNVSNKMLLFLLLVIFCNAPISKSNPFNGLELPLTAPNPMMKQPSSTSNFKCRARRVSFK
ncbi:hypothetical protein D3C81_2083560 [compost metagenome]